MDNPNPSFPPRERIQSFEQMKVWQEAHGLTLRIFEVTPRIPAEQQESLAVLLEKAAIEVPKSIAEGFKRRGSRNKSHYYNLAQSALESLRYMIILGRDLKFDIAFEDLWTRSEQVSRMLDGLIRSMTRSPHGDGRGGGRDNRRGGRGGGRNRDSRTPFDGPSDDHSDDQNSSSSQNDDWEDDQE